MDQKIEVKKIVDWLNKKWQGNKICPICRNNHWSIDEKLVELREFHGGDLVVGGPVFPLIPITCRVCGYTLLFNAIVAQLLVPQKQKVPTRPAKAGESEVDRRREG